MDLTTLMIEDNGDKLLLPVRGQKRMMMKLEMMTMTLVVVMMMTTSMIMMMYDENEEMSGMTQRLYL